MLKSGTAHKQRHGSKQEEEHVACTVSPFAAVEWPTRTSVPTMFTLMCLSDNDHHH